MESDAETTDAPIKKVKVEYNEKEVSAWRKEHEMSISGNGEEAFPPLRSFAESGLCKEVLAYTKNFDKPTPIQAQSWPILLKGRDCIAIAETGSGKTLAFLIPAFARILENKGRRGEPQVFIVSPTRELATQIAVVSEEAGKCCGVRTTCIYGGVPKSGQKRALREGVEVVVGTPGRMADLLEEGVLSPQHVSLMILDEADRMLEAGFEAQISAIFESVQGQRQNMMFSATWPNEVQALAQKYISHPVTIKIGSDEGHTNRRITQVVQVVDGWQKNRLLGELLQKYHQKRDNKIIVFVLYKKEAVRVEEQLNRQGWHCVSIHGDKTQYERNAAYEEFKNGKAKLLIATDVAARGLDIPNVEYVINYTFPLTLSDYVHRIGRTGRAGKLGIAHTFFTINEKNLAGDLCDELQAAGQNVPKELKAFGPSVHKQKEHPLYGKHFKEDASMPQKNTIKKLC